MKLTIEKVTIDLDSKYGTITLRLPGALLHSTGNSASVVLNDSPELRAAIRRLVALWDQVPKEVVDERHELAERCDFCKQPVEPDPGELIWRHIHTGMVLCSEVRGCAQVNGSARVQRSLAGRSSVSFDPEKVVSRNGA